MYDRMKTHKSHTRKEKGGFFALLLALVGISTTGCVCMYGSPTADWAVKGKVIDENGQPVPGL